jgi:PAS domain S-box-containing protein
VLETLAHDGAFFRGIVDAAPDAMVIVDAEGRILLANSQTQELFGYRAEELVGRPVEILVPERYRGEHHGNRHSFAAASSRRPMGLHRDLYAVHRDGSEIPVEISLAPVETVEGALVVAAVRDITERKKFVKETNRLREELIATVSHELRTPLTSIIGYAELLGDLDESDLSPRARGLLSVIERNAGRELRLVDDLLTLAFLEDRRQHLNSAPVDLVHVARRVVDDHLLRAVDADVELRFEGGDVLPVRGDALRLIQVVENLVTNAIKFTPRGGTITVRVHDTDEAAVLEVADTGVGVSPEEKERLFDRLYRAPAAVAAQVQGAGLGLSIVQKILERHHGTVVVDSELGVGTTVTVTLPHAAASS